MEARLRKIVSHLAKESEGHQQEVQVQCAQGIEMAEVKMREFEQNAEAAVIMIRLEAQSSVGDDAPRLAQAEDALRVQARQFRYEREEMNRHNQQMMQGEGAAALAAAEAEKRKNSEETAARMSLYASEVREQALREAALLFQAEGLQIQAEARALVEAERFDKQDYEVQADAMRILMAARAADRISS